MVRDSQNALGESGFFRKIAAAHTGQLVNYARWAGDVGVSEPTVKSWLQVLQACGPVYLLWRVPFWKPKREVDVMLEQDGCLYPVEIKKTAAPTSQHARHFEVLKQFNMPIRDGAVICFQPSLFPLADNVHAFPVGCL